MLFDNLSLLTFRDDDFVPAIGLIKSYGVKTVNLHTYSGSSFELREKCDKHILIAFNEGSGTGPLFSLV